MIAIIQQIISSEIIRRGGTNEIPVIIEQDEDGVFVAHCPALPGCISQGATRKEAQANIKEAITGYLKSLKKPGDLMPPLKLDWRGALQDL